MSDLGLLVATCDRYSDTWPAFHHFFGKFVNDPETISCYVACELTSPSWPSFTPLNMPAGLPWSRQIRHALGQIDNEHILWMQDDYWLLNPVEFSQLSSLCEVMRIQGIDYLRLVPIPPAPEREEVKVHEFSFGLLAEDAPYRRSLQASIWRREYFLSQLEGDCSPWQFELEDQTSKGKHYAVTRLSKLPCNYLASAVVKGKWSVTAQEIARREGLNLGDRRKFRKWEESLLKNPTIFSLRYGLPNFLRRQSSKVLKQTGSAGKLK